MKTGSDRRKKGITRRRERIVLTIIIRTDLQFCESANPGLDPVDVSGWLLLPVLCTKENLWDCPIKCTWEDEFLIAWFHGLLEYSFQGAKLPLHITWSVRASVSWFAKCLSLHKALFSTDWRAPWGPLPRPWRVPWGGPWPWRVPWGPC